MITGKTIEEDQRIVDAVETELRYLRDELHKDLCQRLVALGLGVQVMLRAATQNDSIPVERLASLKKMVDEAIDQTRALLINLNPREPEFGGFGLMTMLQALATERSRHIPC